VLTRTTPQAIFPGRKIGELRDGYAASFLALDGSPIDSLENIKRISVRVKEGNVIDVRPSPAGNPTLLTAPYDLLPRARPSLTENVASRFHAELGQPAYHWQGRTSSP
jgi:hypothetical protein